MRLILETWRYSSWWPFRCYETQMFTRLSHFSHITGMSNCPNFQHRCCIWHYYCKTFMAASYDKLSVSLQGSTLIFKVTCPFGQVRFEIHLSCMRCHLSTNPNPCRNMGIVQFCATIFDFSPVPSDKWHCKTTCPRSHFQHFYLSWTVGQPLRSSPALAAILPITFVYYRYVYIWFPCM